jgi:hypothetical protein
VAISPETLKYGSARYIGVIFPIIFLSLIYFISYISVINTKKVVVMFLYTLIVLISLLLISFDKTTVLDLTNTNVYTNTNSSISRNIIDRNIESEWFSELNRNNGDNIVIELPQVYNIRGFSIDASKSREKCLPSFQFLTSTDNKIWSKPKSFDMGECTSNFTRYIYPEPTKYIKFVVEDKRIINTSTPWAINNLVIYK